MQLYNGDCLEVMKVIELFAGIGAWSKALENLNVAHEVVAAIEFDKKTMDCYNSIHGTTFVAQDITKVNPKALPNCDMICYSPPCQSFSVAGKGLGITDSRGTLFWDALRIIQEKKPKFCLMENVKNLTGKAHRETFDSMLKALEDVGYTNYWQVLNAKDYGIPQNRERVFVVSIRKDIKQTFEFPKSFDNGLRLKDLLEEYVDEKYYVSDEKCQKLLEQFNRPKECAGIYTGQSKDRLRRPLPGISRCLKGGLYDSAVCIPIDPNVLRPVRTEYGKAIRKQYEAGKIHDSRHNMTELTPRSDGITNTLTTVQKDNYLCVPVLTPERLEKRQTAQGGGIGSYTGLYLSPQYRIRKLTPLECIRLMGFSDGDYEKLKESNISNSQIYKVCGNSIVVNVVESIFKQLL